MKRENGFYWVYSYNEWHVAEYKNGYWWVCGDEIELGDQHFEKIIEKRILPPSE